MSSDNNVVSIVSVFSCLAFHAVYGWILLHTLMFPGVTCFPNLPAEKIGKCMGCWSGNDNSGAASGAASDPASGVANPNSQSATIDVTRLRFPPLNLYICCIRT
jgi:hypothetical protein